ncbi:hypothetical protein GUITHDRAFT_62504, partial [Guillardia theta CCMP2712]
YYFSSTLHESYQQLGTEVGPVDLATIYNFCEYMQSKLGDPRLLDRHLVFYAEKEVPFRTNAIFLLSCYLMMFEDWSPERTSRTFAAMGNRLFVMYRDSSSLPASYFISLLDCLRGLVKATKLRWFHYANFDVHKYIWLGNPQNFFLHQPCDKFLLLKAPDEAHETLVVRDYCNLFKRFDVTVVVALGDKLKYDPNEFEDEGIRHVHLPFEDEYIPSVKVVEDFWNVCKEEGTVAVHCSNGGRRSATLISLWIMEVHGWTARDCISWLRIVRPGSIVGPQQHYLALVERSL